MWRGPVSPRQRASCGNMSGFVPRSGVSIMGGLTALNSILRKGSIRGTYAGFLPSVQARRGRRVCPAMTYFACGSARSRGALSFASSPAEGLCFSGPVCTYLQRLSVHRHVFACGAAGCTAVRRSCWGRLQTSGRRADPQRSLEALVYAPLRRGGLWGAAALHFLFPVACFCISVRVPPGLRYAPFKAR